MQSGASSMDATRFSSLDGNDSTRGGEAATAAVAALLTSLNPKAVADGVSSWAAWTVASVSQCFSRMRRAQFDEEHQRSLLSCHTTDGDDAAALYAEEDAAMLELRRRVQRVDQSTQRRTSFAQDLEATYRRHRAVEMANLGAKPQPAPRQRVVSLGASSDDEPQQEPGQDKLSSSFHRLSVDELLALQVAAPSASPSSPSTLSTLQLVSMLEGTKQDNAGEEHMTETQREQARMLRTWLGAVDPGRASEYTSYARQFESQGFQSMHDLAQLDESDVEQAMSEIGISKFAHRARLRKAILRLRQTSDSIGDRFNQSGGAAGG